MLEDLIIMLITVLCGVAIPCVIMILEKLRI